MSRILKRPMFRTGGTPNEGIMHGLVNRKGYDNGSKAEEYADEYYGMLSKYKPPAARFPMGQIGLNLVSGEFAGDGLLANIAGSARGPYEQFVKADDATRGIDYQTKMTAAKMGISRAEAEAVAREKAAGSGMQKDYSPQRNYRDFFLEFSKPPKDRYSKTIQNMYPHALAEYASYIQNNAFKTEEGSKFMQQVDGIIPNVVKGGQAQWQYEKMDAGAFYFHPQYKAFVQREPRTDDAPEQLVVYDPYTFQEVRRVNLQ
jgi:hypothetical protein